MTISNSDKADFLALAKDSASSFATTATAGALHLRDMARNMMLAALEPGARQLDGIITDIKVAVGWEKPNKWASTAANNGKSRQLTADELAKCKKDFAPCFTHVKFFVGEYSAAEIAPDVQAIRRALETGEMALSTAYKAVTGARKAAEKVAQEAAEKAASDAALAAATENVPPRDAAADAADAAATFAAETIAMMEALAYRLAETAARGISDDFAASFAMLDTAMVDFTVRHNATDADAAPEAIAA